MGQEQYTDFEVLDGSISPRMTILNYAESKHGKTWLAASAPGDIGVLGLDKNSRETCNKYKREIDPTKNIIFKDLTRSPLSAIEDINELKQHWRGVRDSYMSLLRIPSVKTVVIDTMSQAWDDCKLAYLGRERPDQSSDVDAKGNATGKKISAAKTMPRDYGEPKRELREMVTAATDLNKNLIMIHRAKRKWVNDKATDEMELEGMSGIEFLSDVTIYQFRDRVTGDFIARLMSSTMNSQLRGREGARVFVPERQTNIWRPSDDELMGDDINFQMVGITVFPETAEDPSIWE